MKIMLSPFVMINFYGHENGILTFIMSPTLHRVYLEWTREILGKYNSPLDFHPIPFLLYYKYGKMFILYRLHSSWIRVELSKVGIHRLTVCVFLFFMSFYFTSCYICFVKMSMISTNCNTWTRSWLLVGYYWWNLATRFLIGFQV